MLHLLQPLIVVWFATLPQTEPAPEPAPGASPQPASEKSAGSPDGAAKDDHATPLKAPAAERKAPARATFEAALLGDLEWRALGPVNMGGRITDLAVDPRRRSTFYVAAATGGVWKTENAGTTFTPIFERGGTSSIGDVAVAPSNGDVVWIGTGEANPRNSVLAGDGVYKSIDGGKSFTRMGLEKSAHIGRIAIDPVDENVVFVAAVGRTWGPNPERGLYRTRDGGASFERVLFVDDKTGAVDVAIDPGDRSVVYAATWERRRDEFDGGDPAFETGPGSGLWRSTDGGASFVRLTKGLPTVKLGRIGIDVWPKDPRVVFALVESELSGKPAPGEAEGHADPAWFGVRGEPHDGSYLVTDAIEGGPAAKAGIQAGDVLVRIGDRNVAGFEELRSFLDDHQAGEECQVVIRRGAEEQTLTVKFMRRPGAPTTFTAGMQGGQNPNAQDKQGPNGFETGGLFRSDDKGESWRRINSIDPRPFYYSQIHVDPKDDQKLYVLGIQFHHSDDGGKTFATTRGRNVHPDHHALWIDPEDGDHLLLGNDGGLYVTWDRGQNWEASEKLPIGQFYDVGVSRGRPYWVIGGLQDNGTWGGPNESRRRHGVPPDLWLNVNGGDGFHAAFDPEDPNVYYAESQNGVLARGNLVTGEGREIRPDDRRLNWNTPFLISPHNSRTLYIAGSRVWKSVDRGDHWSAISEEITRTPRGSATALAESPDEPGVLYVGTDDGALLATRDGGHQWESLVANVHELGGPRYVADLECRRGAPATVFVAFDGHRSDDDQPWLFRSDDYGKSFRRTTDGLPAQPVHCFVTSPRNPALQFVGNDAGVFVSVDEGRRFVPLANNLPTVPVFDLVVHPDLPDLVVATHGRGIWILPIDALEALTPDALAADARLLQPRDVELSSTLPDSTGYAAPRFHTPNPYRGVALWYWLGKESGEQVELTVTNVAGAVVRKLEGPGAAGLHGVKWDLAVELDEAAGGGGRRGRGRALKPGDYLVTLTAGESTSRAPLHVAPDPNGHGDAGIGERDDLDDDASEEHDDEGDEGGERGGSDG